MVSTADGFALFVSSGDDLVPFRDDPARIVARVDDCSRGSVTHMDPPPDDPDKQSAARIAALQKALKTIGIRTDERDSTSRRGAPLEQRGFAEHDLIDEITSTAQGIGRVLVTVANRPTAWRSPTLRERSACVGRQPTGLCMRLYERESSSSSLTRRTGGCYKWQ